MSEERKWAEGKCSQCGAILVRRSPANYGVCDGKGTHEPVDVELIPVDIPSIKLRKVSVYLSEDTIFGLRKRISEKRGELLARYEAMNPKPWENNETWAVFEKEIKKLSLSGFIRESLKEKLREVEE